MNRQELEDGGTVTVTLTLEDDSELECEVITVFSAVGREYIALLPMEGAEEGTGNVFLYRYIEKDGEEPTLENIEDDDEFEAASEAFDEYLDSAEFDELVDEEDQ